MIVTAGVYDCMRTGLYVCVHMHLCSVHICGFAQVYMREWQGCPGIPMRTSPWELWWQDIFLSLKMLIVQHWSINFSNDTYLPARAYKFFVCLCLWTLMGLRVEGLVLLSETILSKIHFELQGFLSSLFQLRQYRRFLSSHFLTGDSAQSDTPCGLKDH